MPGFPPFVSAAFHALGFQAAADSSLVIRGCALSLMMGSRQHCATTFMGGRLRVIVDRGRSESCQRACIPGC